MARTKAQKKRNRKILWYVILIIFTIVQGFLISDTEDVA
jgi:predicted nucleic acid-binding Zn ribbon protein